MILAKKRATVHKALAKIKIILVYKYPLGYPRANFVGNLFAC